MDKKEIEYANAADGKIVPIYIGNATLDCAWDYDIRELQGVHLDSEPTKEQIEAIISHIEHRINYYNSDFAVSYGFKVQNQFNIRLLPLYRTTRFGIVITWK